jgi:hypothetical protein
MPRRLPTLFAQSDLYFIPYFTSQLAASRIDIVASSAPRRCNEPALLQTLLEFPDCPTG